MPHDHLHIPLQPTPTRRVDRRVVWLLAKCLVISLFVIFAFSLWITRDLTSFLRPADTKTVRLFKNAHTTELLHNYLGAEQVIPGSPWSLDELLAQSTREFSVHFNDSGIVGVTVDKIVDQNFIKTAKIFGLITAIEDQHTYIGLLIPEIQHGNRININVFEDGAMFSENHQKIGSLHLNKSGLTIKGIGLASGPMIIEQANDLDVAISIPANTTLIPQIIETNLLINSQNDLLNEIQRVGASISIGHDAAGQSLVIFIPSQKFTGDELAQLGTAMMARSNLTTLELTNPDGSSVLELFSNSHELKSEITTNDSQTTIKLTDVNDEGFKIISTDNGIYLSNRNTFQITNDPISKSACLRSANSYIKPKLIFAATDFPLTKFSEIAWNASSIKFCW